MLEGTLYAPMMVSGVQLLSVPNFSFITQSPGISQRSILAS